MKRLERKHPLAVRWFHWINFPLLAVMIWSGAMIYWANQVYLLKFSEHMWEKLHLAFRLAEGMAIHFFFMWLFAINGIAYFVYLCVKRPFGKYKRLQGIAYIIIVAMGALSILTGLAIYKPVQLKWLAALFGGYEGARFAHFWLTIGYVVFFVVHVVQVIRAGWNNFRAMIIGVEVVNE